MIHLHESRQLFIRLFCVEKVCALRQDGQVQPGGTDVITGRKGILLAGLRHDRGRVLEIPGKEIFFTDDPARRVVLAEGMGEGFMHMPGAYRDGIEAPAVFFWDRRQIHAAVRITLQEHPIELHVLTVFQCFSVAGNGSEKLLSLRQHLLTQRFPLLQDAEDLIAGPMLQELLDARNGNIQFSKK